MAEDSEQRLSDTQRLKAAVHYTVGSLCREVAEDKQVNLSKQAIAAISEITFRQCETFAKDLEMFARIRTSPPAATKLLPATRSRRKGERTNLSALGRDVQMAILRWRRARTTTWNKGVV
ncbi:centromere protein S isoform X2 [Rhinoderma darwinii]|uniref:centromere protein S isoform X2 n=1 Tax=Rhinoderma darwinii TaxID=43563 RepID=UPI003F67F419